MIDEEAFQTALDADPADYAVRLIFADWLDDRGDWRAEGYRWMGTHQKSPQFYVHVHDGKPPDWNWRSQGSLELTAATLPDLFGRIDGYQAATEIWKEFATRRSAEERSVGRSRNALDRASLRGAILNSFSTSCDRVRSPPESDRVSLARSLRQEGASEIIPRLLENDP